MAPRIGIKVRKVIVEHMADEGRFMTMDDEGGIEVHSSAVAVVRWVKRRDERAAKRGESTATLVEWRDMPEGFQAPELPR